MAAKALDEYSDAELRASYALVMSRLLEADAKLWQVPGLSLTAQAFLLTIALGSENHSAYERLTAAALGLIVSVAALQLMERQRFHSKCDVAHLMAVEARGLVPSLAHRERIADAPSPSRFAAFRSAVLWEIVMAVFAAVNVGVGLTTAFHG